MASEGAVILDTKYSQPYLVQAQNSAPLSSAKGKIVASRKGKKYHFSWCPGARTISEKNKRWFESEEQARRAGLTPASNCPGLK